MGHYADDKEFQQERAQGGESAAITFSERTGAGHVSMSKTETIIAPAQASEATGGRGSGSQQVGSILSTSASAGGRTPTHPGAQ